MDIAIYGAGSLGTVLGAYLAKAGVALDLVTRNVDHVKGLRTHGARVVGTVDMAVSVSAIFPGEMAKEYDLIFLMTKQQENDAVAASLLPFLKADGALCTLQNGLPEYGLSEIVGARRTFGCTVAWGATLLGGGVSELTSDPALLSFCLGSFGLCDNEKLEGIKSVLEKMGPVEIEKNFIGARWAKLLINAAFSGLSAVTGGTFGEVAKGRQSRAWAQRIIKECIDVARAACITIEPVQGKDIVRLFDYDSILKRNISNMLIPLAIRKHRKLKASLLQDLEKGKPTEIDYINGLVSAVGRKHGVPTPCNDMVVETVHRIESGELKPAYENLAFFESQYSRRG